MAGDPVLALIFDFSPNDLRTSFSTPTSITRFNLDARVFCLLERSGAEIGLGGPSIVLITGLRKRNESAFTRADYAHVRMLGTEYGRRTPRSVLG